MLREMLLAFHKVARNNCLCSFSVLKARPHFMIKSCSLSLKLACSYIVCIICLGFIFPILCPESYFLFCMSEMLC